MDAFESDRDQIGLHACGEGANSIIEIEYARTAERGGEKSLVGANCVRSPSVSDGIVREGGPP